MGRKVGDLGQVDLVLPARGEAGRGEDRDATGQHQADLPAWVSEEDLWPLLLGCWQSQVPCDGRGGCLGWGLSSGFNGLKSWQRF